jgi:uncharacterized paraquat-inducible protein A
MTETNASGRPVAQTIMKVKVFSTGTDTEITLSCGHVEKVNPLYTWYLGDTRDCSQCMDTWRGELNGRCPRCKRGLHARGRAVTACVNCNVAYPKDYD